MIQNKEHDIALLVEDYCEEFSKEKLNEDCIEDLSEEEFITLQNEERERATVAILSAVKEEGHNFDYRTVETGEVFIYLLDGYPIRLSVKDWGYVEFSWFGNTVRTIESISSLNDLTVLKSRIDYRKTQRVGLDPYMEYSLLTTIDDPEAFASQVLLNALFFKADVNNVVARIKRSNPSFDTVINWDAFMDEY